MRRGVFVTGTGTEVGKTIVAAAIANTARRAGQRVGVFKPAVSGLDDHPPCAEAWESAPQLADHALLRLAAGSAQSDDEIAPYRYGPPLSPHLAAGLAGERIDPERLRRAALGAAEGVDLLVCEGVGGFLVPLTVDYLVRDFARDLGLPVLIAASPGLGTINHTLLTIEAVRASGLDLAGVILTPWPGRPGSMERNNLETIAGLADVDVDVLPQLDPRAPDTWPALTPPGARRRLEAA